MMTLNTQTSILCIVKHEHNEALQTALLIEKRLKSFHINSICVSSHEEKEKIVEAAKNCKVALVIGGDGTMLAAARALHDFKIPLFGINYGKVGFLTEADPNDWEYWTDRVLKNIIESSTESNNTLTESEKLFVEEHMLFECKVIRNDNVIFKGYAVNDAVIARASIARAISLSLYINDTNLSNLRCDGLIVSTPLGATAYAIAAHGPLALPGLDALIITPICPFAGAFPPCVVSGSSIVSVIVDDPSTPVILTLDGQESIPLEYQDKVKISASANRMSLFVSDRAWYVKRLNQRGYIKPGPGSHNNTNA